MHSLFPHGIGLFHLFPSNMQTEKEKSINHCLPCSINLIRLLFSSFNDPFLSKFCISITNCTILVQGMDVGMKRQVIWIWWKSYGGLGLVLNTKTNVEFITINSIVAIVNWHNNNYNRLEVTFWIISLNYVCSNALSLS